MNDLRAWIRVSSATNTLLPQAVENVTWLGVRRPGKYWGVVSYFLVRVRGRVCPGDQRQNADDIGFIRRLNILRSRY